MTNLKEEILDAIDNIDEVTDNSETFVMEAVMGNVRKELDMMNMCDDNEYFQEAKSGNGILSKMWESIKTAIGWIIKQFKKLTSLFTNKKQSASSILSDTMGDDLASKLSNKTFVIIENRKDIEIIFDVNNKNIIKTFVLSMLIKNRQVGAAMSSVHFNLLKHFINNDDNIREKFDKLISELVDITELLKNNQTFKNIAENIDEYRELSRRAKSADNALDALIETNISMSEPSISFKISDLSGFSSFMNDIYDKIRRITFSESVANNGNVITELFKNSLTTTITTLDTMQFALNAILSTVKNETKLDKGLKGVIDNIDDLDKFVGGMIKQGYSSKEIGYNTWFVSGKSLNGDSSFKPKWGQSRITLIPKDKSKGVFKVALNATGINGNKNEQKIYKMLGEPRNLLCPIYESSPNSVVNVMAPLNFTTPEISDIMDVTIRMNNLLVSKDIRIKIDDLHPGNIAKYNNNFVISDYGMITI